MTFGVCAEEVSRRDVPVLRRYDGDWLQQISFGGGRNAVCRLQQKGTTVAWKPDKEWTPEMFEFP